MTPEPSIKLSGSDYFLFAMGRVMRRSGIPGSQCRIILELDGHLDQETFCGTVNDSPLLHWMTGVSKVCRLPFGVPRWRSTHPKVNGHVVCRTDMEIPIPQGDGLLTFPRDEREKTAGPNLSFALANQDGERSVCLMNWDHTLMDAHGAELLLQHVGENGNDRADIRELLPTPEQIQLNGMKSAAGFAKRLAFARKSVRYIAEVSTGPISVFESTGGGEKKADNYYTICFTGEESKRIVANCEKIGLSCYHSLFYLAAALKALQAVQVGKGGEPAPYLVPVPLNLRKKGGTGPAFSNTVSFLFFRITPAELKNLGATVMSLKAQLKKQVREEIPYSYAEMMKLLRRLPLPLYARLLSGPTRGRLASFFFSYTDECCPGMDLFLGHRVRQITHLAPATTIPGLSIVFMRHRDCLQTILSFRDSLWGNRELALFGQQLRSNLLAGGD